MPNFQVDCKIALNKMVTGANIPRGSKIEDTRLKNFRCVYSWASPLIAVGGSMYSLSFVKFPFCPRTLVVGLGVSFSEAGKP